MIYALGAFDGFHLGHQSLLNRARERGDMESVGWGVITFDNHPRTLFSKDVFKTLFTNKERELIAEFLGVRKMIKLTFDRMLASMPPEAFADFLELQGNVSGLVIGSNFYFGKARTGTPEILAGICARRGWSLDVLPPCKIDGTAVSSTAVRDFIQRGQIENGVRFLGYPFLISGRVIKGDGRGKTLGFATANFAVNNKKIYPARGSYAALTYIKNKWHPVALNIGFNPTFDLARRLRCEAHVIGFEGDLYEKEMYIFVFAKNRNEIQFSCIDTLKTKLKQDVRNIKNCAEQYIGKNEKIFHLIKSVL